MTATPEMAEYCLRVIGQQISDPDAPSVPLPVIPKEDSACFVTLTTLPHDRLRGCIGSLRPGDLKKDMRRLAIAAAFQDSRFPKVKEEELPTLRCCFSLLHTFEPCSAWNDWEIGKHGLIAEYGDYSATYLPSVAEEQGWNHRETLVSLMEKAGFEGAVTDQMLKKLRITRYQVSKAFKDYKDIDTL
ncbi:putative AMMECR1 [Leishmania utingensis]|uniref:AMMECR1 n=1 Tax=Leishmania utingensis TaxID=653362 RepID=A0AAW3A2X2_9TRYP